MNLTPENRNATALPLTEHTNHPRFRQNSPTEFLFSTKMFTIRTFLSIKKST